MNQSEFEANTEPASSAENYHNQLCIGFVLASHWVKRVHVRFVNQSQNGVKQSVNKRRLSLTLI